MDYPAPSRRLSRWIGVGAFALFVLTAFWWEPLLAHRIQAVAWRQECLSYTPPADQIVFEEDPSSVRDLEDQPGYELTVGSRVRWVPAFWLREAPGLQTQGTVFLHSLTSRNGHARLVGVDVSITPGIYLATTGNIEDMTLTTTVIEPAGGLMNDRVLRLADCALWVCPVTVQPMRFFAGKIDPNDPAHFTFDYQRAGVRGTIDGRLNDDGTVTLLPRAGKLSTARLPLMWQPDVPK
jgi:hypothetical protein